MIVMCYGAGLAGAQLHRVEDGVVRSVRATARGASLDGDGVALVVHGGGKGVAAVSARGAVEGGRLRPSVCFCIILGPGWALVRK